MQRDVIWKKKMAPESKRNFVYELLRDDIVAGRFPVGSKLPGGLELAKRYQVAHMTVRSAVKRLAAENYVAFVNGSGTFVTNRDEKPVYLILSSNLSDFTLPGNYVVPGIQRAMSLAGAQTKLCIRDFISQMSRSDFRKLIVKEKIKGIFLVESYFHGTEPELDLLKSVDVPIVMPIAAECDKKICPFSMIIADFEKAFAEALLYLKKLGHRRVTTINGSGWSFRGYPRENFEVLLLQHRMEGSLILDADLNREEISSCVDKIIAEEQTAVLCYSDFYAIEVIRELRERGLCVPEDISVMGFCGYPGGEFTVPPLSTMDLCYDTVGVMAAELMLKSQDWFGRENVILESPQVLQIRKSTRAWRENLRKTI